MQSLTAKIATEKLSTYAAVISIFTFTILLDMDFSCTCKPQVSTCNLYMYLPPFIIFVLILVADSSFQSICRYYSSHCKCLCGLCCFYVNHFLRALLVGSLWVAFLFLDGDWYVCCRNDGSEEQAQLACKAEKDIKDNEKALKAELKNTSRHFGGCILFGIVVAAFILTLFKKYKCGKEDSCCFNKRFLYEKLIIKEEGNVLKEILRNSVKERLTEEIKKKILANEWKKPFDVAKELIEKPASNENPKQEEFQMLLQQSENETLFPVHLILKKSIVPVAVVTPPADNPESTA